MDMLKHYKTKLHAKNVAKILRFENIAKQYADGLIGQGKSLLDRILNQLTKSL